MLRLRDIMTSDLLTVSPETSVREALELLGGRHVSGAPVISGGKLVGLVTGTDLMTFVAALPGVPTQRETQDESGDWPDPSVEADVENERESASAFYSELWDDVGADVTERIASVEGPEWNMLEEHDVSEVMTSLPLVTLVPDADVEEAADLMKEKGIHRILVTDGHSLLGVVSALDVAKAVAERKLTRRTYVFNRDRDHFNRE
jgi:CBS domain-containing protein